MPPFLQKVRKKINRAWSRSTFFQRVLVFLASLMLIPSLVLITTMFAGDDFRLTLSDASNWTESGSYESKAQDSQENVQRFSMAVLVEGTYSDTSSLELQHKPLSKEEIQQLVERSTGFDAEHTDLRVSRVSLDIYQNESRPQYKEEQAGLFQTFGSILLYVLLVLLFICLVFRPMLLTFFKTGKPEESKVVESTCESEECTALASGISGDNLKKLQDMTALDGIKNFTCQLAEQNFEQAFAVIKKWLKEEKL